MSKKISSEVKGDQEERLSKKHIETLGYVQVSHMGTEWHRLTSL